MSANLLPRHVAIIMDGNGRWAKQRHLPRMLGHKAGVESVRQIVKSCAEKKIDVLTLFAFSSENWRRPLEEVSYLMSLFVAVLEREVKKLHAQNIQLRIIGDRAQFNEKLRELMTAAEALTANNTGLKLVIAANYGGQWDITMAACRIAEEIENGSIARSDITPQLIQKKLSFADFPDPDLLIRTSGERRISNFMLWQLAYTELYFTDVLWPDFNAAELDKAFTFFRNCERRFGYISEQLRVSEDA
ncbi:MAG TPA: isoprenyl transferase [Gammaproteobacteria bacterium]|nr:isoprenyl transferase [Gammaproteobacteria bacterium]